MPQPYSDTVIVYKFSFPLCMSCATCGT